MRVGQSDMKKDRFLSYVIVGGLAILPLVALPFLGAEFIVAVDGRGQQQEQSLPPDDGEPVRLVVRFLVDAGRRGDGDLIAILDLQSRESASVLCKVSPNLLDEVTVFTAENPSRVNRETRIPGKDPVLLNALLESFPKAVLTAARIGEPESYQRLHPPRDVYECSGRSYQRIAKKDG